MWYLFFRILLIPSKNEKKNEVVEINRNLIMMTEIQTLLNCDYKRDIDIYSHTSLYINVFACLS